MKKILSLVLVLVMALGLFAGCQDNTPTDPSTPAVDLAGKYELKIWVAENHVELTKSLVAKFNESNEHGIEVVATVEPLGEGEAATTMINDVEMGADIFTFAQDQTARLIEAGALSALGNQAKELVSSTNAAGVVSATMSGDKMYAYPMTADNGYFMYYDKSVISEDEIGTLEGLIAACEKAGRYFAFQLEGSGWYTASFFFGAGCVSSFQTNDDGKFDTFNDTFCSDTGIIASLGMQKLLQSSCYLNSSNAPESFSAATPAAVVISGTWDYDNTAKVLLDNMGVAKLPTFEVDGKTYQLGSFNGCKLMGVKPQSDTKKAAVAHLLAQYMTNEESQLARFNALSWGPSNLKAQESEAVKANPGLTALLAQSPYSIPQGQVPADWWTTAQTLATGIKESAKGDKAAIQTHLDAYQAAIELMANPATQLDPDQWTVIGIGGWNSGDDKMMTEQPDGTWKTDEALELKAGDEFKIRKGGQWDGNEYGVGSDNYKVEADGTYYIVADVVNKTITLIPA